jgi:hypothetical protein
MSSRSLLLEFTQQHRWWEAVGSIYIAVHLGKIKLSSVIIEPFIV